MGGSSDMDMGLDRDMARLQVSLFFRQDPSWKVMAHSLTKNFRKFNKRHYRKVWAGLRENDKRE